MPSASQPPSPIVSPASGHSLWPQLARSKSTWLNAVSLGAVDPAQIRALTDEDLTAIHPTAAYYVRKLAANLPDISGNPATITAIIVAHAAFTTTQAQIESLQTGIEHAAQQPPFDLVTSRWLTIPSVSLIALATLHVASDGRAQEFTRESFVSAVGQAPVLFASGTSKKARQRRPGYRPAMKAIHMWALRLPNARTRLARILWAVARNPAGYKFQAKE